MPGDSPTIEITVHTKMGDREIWGTPRGPFVIHRSTDQDSFFTLTHTRSGFALAKRLCCQYSAEQLADSLMHFNWEFDAVLKDGKGRFPKAFFDDMQVAALAVGMWPERCGRCAPRPRIK